MTTTAELAAALAFVLQKWKDAGAPESEMAPFDELLLRVAAEPQPEQPKPDTPSQPSLVRGMVKNLYPETRPTQRLPMSDKLKVLDAEIDAANREARDD